MGVVWVNGRERLLLFTYDSATHSFAEASPGIAANRPSITTTGLDESLTVAPLNVPALVVANSTLSAAAFIEGSLVTKESPRLEFMVGSIRVGTLTASGFRANLLTEAAPAFLSPGG